MLTEPTKLEMLQSNFSDTFKDVHGFRPRNMSQQQWTSEAWLEAQLEELYVELKQQIKEEEYRNEYAIKTFEENISQTMRLGNVDRATAIRWLMEAENCEDVEHFCYINSLPLDYL